MEGLFCWEPPTSYFPSQTIHLAIVDPGVGSSRSIVAIRTENQVFIAPDNGVLTLILRDTRLEQAVWVTNPQYMLEPVSRTFHGRDVFAPAAAHLASGIDFASLGSMADPRHLVRLPLERAGVSENGILAGSITHIDHFGNLVTDIDRHRLHHFIGGRSITDVEIVVGDQVIRGVSESYSDAVPGRFLAVMGSREMLELAVNQGHAAERTGLKTGDRVFIRSVN